MSWGSVKDVGSTFVQSASVVGSKIAKAAQVHSLKELVSYTKPSYFQSGSNG